MQMAKGLLRVVLLSTAIVGGILIGEPLSPSRELTD